MLNCQHAKASLTYSKCLLLHVGWKLSQVDGVTKTMEVGPGHQVPVHRQPEGTMIFSTNHTLPPRSATSLIAQCSLLQAPSCCAPQTRFSGRPSTGYGTPHRLCLLSGGARCLCYPSGMWAPTGFVQGEGFGIIVDRLLKDLKSASYCGATLVR